MSLSGTHAAVVALLVGVSGAALSLVAVTGGPVVPAAPALAAPVDAAPVVTAPVVTARVDPAPPDSSLDPAGARSGATPAVPTSSAQGRSVGEVVYDWPTGGPADLVRDFTAPAQPWGSGHRGVDLAHSSGSAVRTAADGVVVFAGQVVDRPVVSVQHADGVRTTYEPVSPVVATGDRVRRGEVLGLLESGHCPVWELTTCLHWGARTGPQSYVDPMDLLGLEVVVRLLPADLAGLP
ncbi:M23 family metallopeptidase [Georgenia muralis]|uniref:Peptidase M23-like protein n=1 Tax=Georgenia muralis TaxID=154117 RepID=A0A3N4Z673_9MICO|nr:M23 family metallopeptidase [Georgenia muralis]RPF27837.1 peptidase M23-like protein [Georgenia muralis]